MAGLWLQKALGIYLPTDRSRAGIQEDALYYLRPLFDDSEMDRWLADEYSGVVTKKTKAVSQESCTHKSVMPEYDEEAAKGLSAEEIRKRWPRFHGRCPDCNQMVILYACVDQYIMGDY